MGLIGVQRWLTETGACADQIKHFFVPVARLEQQFDLPLCHQMQTGARVTFAANHITARKVPEFRTLGQSFTGGRIKACKETDACNRL
jgi:hypothetical protein